MGWNDLSPCRPRTDGACGAGDYDGVLCCARSIERLSGVDSSHPNGYFIGTHTNTTNTKCESINTVAASWNRAA